ncbi:PPOX class F420-dependent oxidoreductase [Halostreptopolyspora alba]|uniref:PPOX class F420-dependent oxidoreductase n=2 Tax=Halostreptopolyspora alba TaxID=2487137 RepID=A0A3N0EFC7_9ACTN|nr:PPOX class F420-dependent oxidoreductase [Nocardiopsaceae bacterium YIM 96095]
MIFNEAERSYLESQFLGRLATVGSERKPQVRPLGYRLNPEGTIDLGGPNVAATRRWRNVQANPWVSFVVDDLTPKSPDAIRPGWGRGVEVRGRAETLTVDNPPGASEMAGHDIIRIHPERVISWHIDPDMPEGRSVDVS